MCGLIIQFSSLLLLLLFSSRENNTQPMCVCNTVNELAIKITYIHLKVEKERDTQIQTKTKTKAKAKAKPFYFLVYTFNSINFEQEFISILIYELLFFYWMVSNKISFVFVFFFFCSLSFFLYRSEKEDDCPNNEISIFS